MKKSWNHKTSHWNGQ